MSEQALPRPPSTAYSDYVKDTVARRIADLDPVPDGVDYQEQAGLWDKASARAEELEPELTELLQDLHAHPETAFEEFRSRDALATLLRRHGHRVALGVHGVATSLRSDWKSEDFDPEEHPTIAVMAEYDALPDIGHACGHNIIAAAGVGAYLTAVDTLETLDKPARVVLMGTPAEEGFSGKGFMLDAGMLDGIDAAVMVHPFSFDIASHVWIGRRAVSVTFEGLAAHASSQPFKGRNALDAATLAYQAIGLLRQQMPPSDRIHAVITHGGGKPAVIPQRASLLIYMRSSLMASLSALTERINDILTGAGLMAGVRVHREWDRYPASLPMLNNETLADRWTRTQVKRGRRPLPADVVPETLAASTDFGNVSHLVPSIHPTIKVSPESVPLHTAEFAKWSAGPGATTAAVDAAAGLAQVVVDLVADPDLMEQALREFHDAETLSQDQPPAN